VPIPARLTLHQGVDLGRPSLLLVDVEDDTRTVRVTGTATPLPPSPHDTNLPDPAEDRSTT
jgi:predicted PhzF superfamily epimerase YddE/YHI9